MGLQRVRHDHSDWTHMLVGLQPRSRFLQTSKQTFCVTVSLFILGTVLGLHKDVLITACLHSTGSMLPFINILCKVPSHHAIRDLSFPLTGQRGGRKKDKTKTNDHQNLNNIQHSSEGSVVPQISLLRSVLSSGISRRKYLANTECIY